MCFPTGRSVSKDLREADIELDDWYEMAGVVGAARAQVGSGGSGSGNRSQGSEGGGGGQVVGAQERSGNAVCRGSR